MTAVDDLTFDDSKLIATEVCTMLADSLKLALGPAELPKSIGDYLKANHLGTCMHTLGYGPAPMSVTYQSYPDGSLKIMMTDCQNWIFWQHHLRVADA